MKEGILKEAWAISLLRAMTKLMSALKAIKTKNEAENDIARANAGIKWCTENLYKLDPSNYSNYIK